MTLALLMTGPSAAWAHEEVVATSPAQDATVPTAPHSVELELSQPPEALGTQVLVSGPDGAPVSRGDAAIRDTTVVQPLVEDLPAGTYTVQLRVTSSDGHPISGAFSFAVAEGAVTAPGEPRADEVAPEPQPAGLEETAADRSADSSLPLVWIAVGAALLLAAGGMLTRRMRARG